MSHSPRMSSNEACSWSWKIQTEFIIKYNFFSMPYDCSSQRPVQTHKVTGQDRSFRHTLQFHTNSTNTPYWTVNGCHLMLNVLLYLLGIGTFDDSIHHLTCKCYTKIVLPDTIFLYLGFITKMTMISYFPDRLQWVYILRGRNIISSGLKDKLDWIKPSLTRLLLVWLMMVKLAWTLINLLS